MDRKPGPCVAIADDYQFLADACKSMLEPEFDVLGLVTHGRALVKAALAQKPDVLLELSIPLLNGLDAGEQINQKLPNTRPSSQSMRSSVKW